MTNKERVITTKIKLLQLDPFSYCNAKCWYCPVKYEEQPKENIVHMSLDMMESLFDQITFEKDRPDGIVIPSFNAFYTAHYNEILLYKHFEGMLELARKHKFVTPILSNGVNLTKAKVDIIKEYRDVVCGIGLNIPAFEKDVWSDRAGMHPKLFDKLISNLNYATTELSYMGQGLHIQINGIDDEFSGWYGQPGPEFNKLNFDTDPKTGELAKQLAIAKQLFPSWNIVKFPVNSRSEKLKNVVTFNRHITQRLNDNKKIKGCDLMGDRATEWIHVNSTGDFFLCCNDYNFEYKFGSLANNSLREIWHSQEHINVIDKAFNEICVNCNFALTE